MRNLLFVVAMVFVASCAGTDNQFRLEGAGLPLYTAQTDKNTANLNKYFGALCLQAGFQSENCAPSPSQVAPGNWNLLVQTGYNDIDYRCDAYLSWIDSKRTERILFDGTTNALGVLAAGVLKGSSASADTLANVALALGFVKDIYSSYQNSILLGLEGSTIKEIVNKRRAAHRKAYAGAQYNSRPEAVYALRAYLTYCTPQNILSDVNSFSRGAASGNPAQIMEEARASAQVVGANAPATPGRRNTGVLQRIEIFESAGHTTEDVRRLQRAACLPADGVPGAATIAAISMLEDIKGDVFDSNPKISDSEWATVETQLVPCDGAKYKNLYENLSRGANEGRGLVEQLALVGLSTDLVGKPIHDPAVRAGIAALREEKGAAETLPGMGSVTDQITPFLVRKLGLPM